MYDSCMSVLCRAKQADKRKAREDDPQPTKRQRTKSGKAGTPTTPTPPPPAPPPAPPTSEQVYKLQELIATLLENGQTPAVQVIVDQLTPGVLVELFMNCMDHLPPYPPADESYAAVTTGSEGTAMPAVEPEPSAQPAQLPQQPAAAAAHDILTAALASTQTMYMPPGPLESGGQLGFKRQLPPPPPPPPLVIPGAGQIPLTVDTTMSNNLGVSSAPSPAGTAATAATEQQPVDPRRQRMQQQMLPPAAMPLKVEPSQQAVASEPQPSPLGAVAGTSVVAAANRQPAAAARQRPGSAVAKPAGPPRPTPLPIHLSAQSSKALRHGAVRRILRSGNTPIRNFRELLLSRLATKAPTVDGLADIVLEYILEDFHGRRGHELAIRWLYSLFITLCPTAEQGVAADAPAQEVPTAGDVIVAGRIDRGIHVGEVTGAHIMHQDSVHENDADGGTSASSVVPANVAASERSDAQPSAELLEANQAENKGDAMEVDASTATIADTVEEDEAGAADVDDSDNQQPDSALHAAARGNQEGVGTHEGAVAALDQGPSHQQAPAVVPVNDLSGSVYEDVLMALLEGLRERLPGTDKSITRLLEDAPVVPLTPVISFLRDLSVQGPEWATLALTTARQLIEQHPPVRQHALEMVLHAAIDVDADLRSKAMRLLANKLFPAAHLAAQIESFARDMLLRLEQQPVSSLHDALEGQNEPQQQKQEQQPIQQAEDALPSKPQLHTEATANGAAEATAAATAGEADATHNVRQSEQHQQQQQASDSMQRGVSDAQDATATVVKAEAPNPVEPELEPLSEEDAARFCGLYIALCSKKPELLRQLLHTYGKSPAAAQAAMDQHAASLAHALGPLESELLEAIRQPPAGSERLLLYMLHTLAEQAPPRDLVAACVANYQQTGAQCCAVSRVWVVWTAYGSMLVYAGAAARTMCTLAMHFHAASVF